jgi:hypothetical protein
MHRLIFKCAALACAVTRAMLPAATARGDEVAQPAAVQLEITGPRLIHRGDEVHFRVFLTNRSPETIIIPSPTGACEPGLVWLITDSAGKPLPPPPAVGFFCPVTGRPAVGDSDFVLLNRGERIEIPVDGDPTDSVMFRGEGFYRVSVTYHFYPPKIWRSADGKTTYMTGISNSRMTPAWLERVMKTPPIHATSTLSMYLISFP